MSTYTLTGISEGKSTYSAVVADGTGTEKTYIVEEDLWRWGRLKPGAALTEDDVTDMSRLSLITQGLAHMRKILSYAPISRAALIGRMVEKYGYGEDIAAVAADYAEEHGLIDEHRQAEHLADICLHRKCFGKKRIVEELTRRGYSEALTQSVTDAVSDEEYRRVLLWLLHQEYKTLPEDAEGTKRMVFSLLRLGYTPDEIKAAVALF